jgi:hypothetical protein
MSVIITRLAPVYNFVVTLCLLGMEILDFPILQGWSPYFNLEVMTRILRRKTVVIQQDCAYALL